MTNFEYINQRAAQSEHYDEAVITAFYHSLRAEDQEIIKDIFSYNGHAYYTTHTHTLNKYQYTDDNEGASFDSHSLMHLYLQPKDPIERFPRANAKDKPAPATKYLLAYVARTSSGAIPAGEPIDKDIYEPFIDGTTAENFAQAKARYQELKNTDNIHTANLCQIIESTDYFD